MVQRWKPAGAAAALGCLGVVMLTGVSEGGDVPLPSSGEAEGVGNLMAVRGELELHRQCVVMRSGTGELIGLVWPEGYTADLSPLRVYNAAGDVVAGEDGGFRGGGDIHPRGEVDGGCGLDKVLVISGSETQ